MQQVSPEDFDSPEELEMAYTRVYIDEGAPDSVTNATFRIGKLMDVFARCESSSLSSEQRAKREAYATAVAVLEGRKPSSVLESRERTSYGSSSDPGDKGSQLQNPDRSE
jgi:hypothetical protein